MESASGKGYGFATSEVASRHKSCSEHATNHIQVLEGTVDTLASHCDNENFLDLSDADFAPSLSSTTISLARNSDILIDQTNSASLSQELKPKDSINHSDPRVCGVPSSQPLSFKGKAEEFTEDGFVTETKENSQGLTNGLLTENGLHLSHGGGDFSSPTSLSSEGKQHKTEGAANVISGIKVLHYDETINKDYVVTFGRKWEPVPSHGLSTSDDRASDDSCPSSPTFGKPIPTKENDQSNDHRTLKNVDDIGNTDVVEEEHTPHLEQAIGLSENVEENFVTPDDSVAIKHNPPGVDFISFDMDVELTDDDLRIYLNGEGTELEPSDTRESEEDIQRPPGEEFFTPMDENSLQPIVISTIHNEETDVRNESSGTDVPTDFVMAGDSHLESAENDAKENSSDSAVLVNLDDDASQLTPINDDAITKVSVPITHGLGRDSDAVKVPIDNVNQQMDSSDTSVINTINDSQDVSINCRFVGGHKSTMLSVSESDVDPESETEARLSQTAYGREEEEEELRSDEMLLNTDAEGAKAQHRLQRPTSLHLSGKIEVARPAEVIDQEDLDSESHKHFGSLTVTAGELVHSKNVHY